MFERIVIPLTPIIVGIVTIVFGPSEYICGVVAGGSLGIGTMMFLADIIIARYRSMLERV